MNAFEKIMNACKDHDGNCMMCKEEMRKVCLELMTKEPGTWDIEQIEKASQECA